MVYSHKLPIGPMSDADVERFRSYVDRRGDDECWPWLAGCDCDRRGYFSLRRKNLKAPRIAYYLATGSDPGDLIVCHSRNCNDPNCVNPQHLYLGTDLDNGRDRVACGRQARGEGNGRAKLTAAIVIEIRRRYATEPISVAALAREYGVSPRAINKIVRHDTWRLLAAASNTSASMAIPTLRSVADKGFQAPDYHSTDGSPLPSAACSLDSIESADLPTEPQAKADERRQFLDPLAHDEQRVECPYQVAS